MRRFKKEVSGFVLGSAIAVLLIMVSGCGNQNGSTNSNNASDSSQAPADQTQDPAAAANMAPVGNNQPTGAYEGQPQNYDQNYDDNAEYQNTSYGQPDLEASGQPPDLPDYSQPDCPGDGYIWTPGYWGYSSQGYYWVPGAWVQPPEAGLLWTPGFWAFSSGRYRYHNGYWGRHIGYYGGVNYGFGYDGEGYEGGYWKGDRFEYNRAANNINRVHVAEYNHPVPGEQNNRSNRVSFNGPGGISRRPAPAEIAATREQRVPPMTTQVENQRSAAQNRQQFASANGGHPAIAAASKPIPEGKLIAPVIPARSSAPNPSSRPAPEPNRAEGSKGPSGAPPQNPAESRKSLQPGQPASRPGAPSAERPPAPATPEPRNQPQEESRPQAAPERRAPAQELNPKPQTNSPAVRHAPLPEPAPKAVTPAPHPSSKPVERPETRQAPAPQKQEQRPATEAKPKNEAPPKPKKEEPEDKRKPE